MGRRGREWVLAAASPAAVAASYERLVEALDRRVGVAGPPIQPAGPPVGSRPRGFLIVDQEGRPPGPEGQGQEGPLPGRDAVPDARAGDPRHRPRHHRLRPFQRAGRRRLPADHQRPLARRLRLRPLRHRGVRQARRRPRGAGRQRPAGQQRLPAHRRAQPRRRRHPLARLHVGRGRQAGHARRVPGQLRRRAHRRLPEVPGEPERRQGVHRGRDEVPTARTASCRSPCGTARRTRATATATSPASTTSTSTTTAWSSPSPSRPGAPRSTQPPWAADLAELGAVDSGQVAPTTTLPGGSTPSTVATTGTGATGSSEVIGATEATAPTATTVAPSTTAAPTTTTGG